MSGPVTIKVTITPSPFADMASVEAVRVVESSWTPPEGWHGFNGLADIVKFEAIEAAEEAAYKWDPE